MRAPNPHKRESLAIMGLVCFAILLLIALAHIQAAAGSEPNRVEQYTCGKAVGVHDNTPGYHIIKRAHYKQFEDGSGILYCGHVVMVRVGVPW